MRSLRLDLCFTKSDPTTNSENLHLYKTHGNKRSLSDTRSDMGGHYYPREGTWVVLGSRSFGWWMEEEIVKGTDFVSEKLFYDLILKDLKRLVFIECLICTRPHAKIFMKLCTYLSHLASSDAQIYVYWLSTTIEKETKYEKTFTRSHKEWML